MSIAIGKEVQIGVLATNPDEMMDFPITLPPGATSRTIFAALNQHYGTNFNTEHFRLVLEDAQQGHLSFERDENVSISVQTGSRLWIVPSGDMNFG